MLGKVANLGLFNLKSQVTTPGNQNYTYIENKYIYNKKSFILFIYIYSL